MTRRIFLRVRVGQEGWRVKPRSHDNGGDASFLFVTMSLRMLFSLHTHVVTVQQQLIASWVPNPLMLRSWQNSRNHRSLHRCPVRAASRYLIFSRLTSEMGCLLPRNYLVQYYPLMHASFRSDNPCSRPTVSSFSLFSNPSYPHDERVGVARSTASSDRYHSRRRRIWTLDSNVPTPNLHHTLA